MDAKKIIMVVDDEDDMRVALAGFFQLDGYSVILCGSGSEAIEKWSPEITHIVSDVRMPGMDGLELVKRLKAQKNSITVVICTANEGVLIQSEQLIKEYGLKAVLEKPVLFETLKKALELF